MPSVPSPTLTWNNKIELKIYFIIHKWKHNNPIREGLKEKNYLVTSIIFALTPTHLPPRMTWQEWISVAKFTTHPPRRNNDISLNKGVFDKIFHQVNFSDIVKTPTQPQFNLTIPQLLLAWFWPNIKGRLLGPSSTYANCHCDICPGNICPCDIRPYQEYLSCY